MTSLRMAPSTLSWDGPQLLRRAFSHAVKTGPGPLSNLFTTLVRVNGVLSSDWWHFGLCSAAVGLRGTSPAARCVVLAANYGTASSSSRHGSALSIHEWSLFTESVTQPSGIKIDRGTLLINRPDNRRPLDSE